MNIRHRYFRRITHLSAVLVIAVLVTGTPQPAAGATVANDDFRRATVVRSLPATMAQNTDDASVERDEPGSSCSKPFKTVWYELRAPRSSRVVVDMTGSSYDNVVAIYTGRTLNDLTEVACTDDAWTAFDAVAGQTYFVQVSGWVWTSGDMKMRIFESSPLPPPPSNDDRADAAVISSLPFADTVDVRSATWDYEEEFVICADGYQPVVWYRYETAFPREVTVDTLGSDYDTAVLVRGVIAHDEGLSARSGTSGCNDDYGGTLQSSVTFNAVPGVTYLIQVTGTYGPEGTLRFNAR